MDQKFEQVGAGTDTGEIILVSASGLMEQCIRASESSDTKPDWRMATENFAALGEDERRFEFEKIIGHLLVDLDRLAGGLDVSNYAWTVMSLVWEARETKSGSELAGLLFEKMFKEYGERLPTEWDERVNVKGITKRGYLAVNLLFREFGPFVEYLAERTEDSEINSKMGMLIRVVGMPDLANGLRYRLLRGGFRDLAQKEGLMWMLRDILGYPEVEEYYRKIGVLAADENLPLPLSLGEVYASDDFSQYLVSLETQKFRLANLVKIFEKLGVGKDAKICDAGCGTGWLMGDLLKAGYTNVTGFDIDPGNLEKAKGLYPGAEFVQGEINELGYEFRGNEQDVILMLGRTATHASDWDELGVYFDEIYDSLAPGGIAVIDWPNPDVPGGVYQEYRDCMKKAYARHGFSEEEVEGVEVIFDGPAARGARPLYPLYMYNRLTPHLDRLEARLPGFGFDLLEKIVEELPNGTGKDQNVVLVLKKKNYPDSGAKMMGSFDHPSI